MISFVFMAKERNQNLSNQKVSFNKEAVAHLPTHKKDELEYLVGLIQNLINPEMIILYGSYSTGKAVEDIYREDGITYEYQSDYDLLLVVENEHQLPKGYYHKIIKEAVRSGECKTPVSIICHSVKYVNQELESGNFFFVEVARKQGKVLYDTKNYTLVEPKQLSPKDQQNKA